MGLDSNQGSMKGLDNWSGPAVLDQIINPVRESPQSSTPPLKCPRCSSSNTKFCYYNNYNRSQPRHFCKSCRRHWTQGGTLRNVPVGGGRKNKRLKTTVTTPPTTNTNSTSSSSSSSDQSSRYGLKHHDQQPWLRGGCKVLQEACFQPDNYEENIKSLVGSDPPSLLPFSSGALLGNNPYNYVSTTNNSTITTTAAMDPSSAQLGSTKSSVDDSLSYWSWDYFDTLVSTDLNLPWEDFQEQVLEV